MCLIVFAYKQHKQYPLILLANRDEYYDRPTRGVHFWEDAPEVFAGRDLLRGGTWLGISKSGRFATLTNYRQADGPRGTMSRGKLVSNFIAGTETVPEYLGGLRESSGDYSGFNLLVGHFSEQDSEMGYFSNRAEESFKLLEPGIYGLSNHLLDTSWPKVSRAKSRLATILADDQDIENDKLFELLSDRTQASKADLPDTGIGSELEKLLSPVFIETPIYGTRCSSVVSTDPETGLSLVERVFR